MVESPHSRECLGKGFALDLDHTSPLESLIFTRYDVSEVTTHPKPAGPKEMSCLYLLILYMSGDL